MELSFGEQIKIILKRKNMTIQDLAFLYEANTGVKMTRQNLSQRLRRDNFQEQDMHALAAMLGYQVSIHLSPLPENVQPPVTIPAPAISAAAPVIPVTTPVITPPATTAAPVEKQVTSADGSTFQIPNLFRKPQVQGEVNPLTGEEYLSNTVRQHPSLSGYVQVYDRSTHEWIDVNEDYFWEFQANKKQILGSDYQEPILI